MTHAVAPVHLDDRDRRAVEFLLHVATDRLGMDAAFFAEVNADEQIHHATTGASADSFTIRCNERLPRQDGYCRHVIERDEAWLIRDTSEEPLIRDLAVTRDGRFGAYLGVPVRDDSGRPFGTLCVMHHTPRPDLSATDVAIVESLAELLGRHLVDLDAGRRSLGRLAAQVTELMDSLEQRGRELDIYRRILDASLNVTLLLDLPSLQVSYANPAACELAGCPRSEMLGRAPWELHPCWEEGPLRDALDPLTRPDAPPLTYSLPPTAGAPALDVQAQRLIRTDGQAAILWTGHDVERLHAMHEHLTAALTLEKAAAEELRRLDSLRSAFLTAVSHELRTPLTVVKGVAELLKRGHHPADEQPHLLARLVENADRLERLLTDLLDLNRYSRGSLELQRLPVRLDELVRRTCDELDLDGRELILDLAAITLDLAPVKVERIVANLLRNATIHTPPGTPITVRVSPHPEGALIVVADRGAGIPERERRRLFEPFQQGETAAAHRPGTGIGLSLVAAFTELHGGRVWVEDAPDGGAAFHVVLPTEGPD